MSRNFRRFVPTRDRKCTLQVCPQCRDWRTRHGLCCEKYGHTVAVKIGPRVSNKVCRKLPWKFGHGGKSASTLIHLCCALIIPHICCNFFSLVLVSEQLQKVRPVGTYQRYGLHQQTGYQKGTTKQTDAELPIDEHIPFRKVRMENRG